MKKKLYKKLVGVSVEIKVNGEVRKPTDAFAKKAEKEIQDTLNKLRRIQSVKTKALVLADLIHQCREVTWHSQVKKLQTYCSSLGIGKPVQTFLEMRVNTPVKFAKIIREYWFGLMKYDKELLLDVVSNLLKTFPHLKEEFKGTFTVNELAYVA